MGDSKWDIGDNLKSVLLAVVLVTQLGLTLWLKSDGSEIKRDAVESRAASDKNAARIKALSTEVRNARNEGRKAMGLPPLAATKEDPE